MKPVRLLPIVIFAAVALLFFKGFSLLTTGSYVFSGATMVVAAEGHDATPSAEGGGEPTMTLPSEPTMTDSSPVLDDNAPTLAAKDDPSGHGTETKDAAAAAEPAHGDAPAEPDATAAHTAEAQPAAGHDETSAATPATDCAADGDGPTTEEIGAAIADATHGAPVAASSDCPPADPTAEGVPMTNENGELVPLSSADGAPMSEKALLERLATRRAELDSRDAELSMRLALVEAAEKRLDERTTALKDLEARINALVDEKKAMEDAQFKGLVGMYETMKPGEAATIFDNLDMNVLLRLAKNINPRKMAPIMAKMTAAKAQELTGYMAADQGEPAIDVGATDTAALPQIVGQ